MKAYQILQYIGKNQIDKLQLAAENELRIDIAREKGGSTQVQRQRAAKKYLSGPNLSGKAWEENGYQCFTNGYSGFMLKPGLEVPLRENAPLEMSKHFRDPSGTEVGVDWEKVAFEAALQKGAGGKKVLHPVKVGPAYYNPSSMIAIKNVLGGEQLKIFHGDKEISNLQFECENGMAMVLPMRVNRGDQLAAWVDVTLPVGNAELTKAILLHMFKAAGT